MLGPWLVVVEAAGAEGGHQSIQVVRIFEGERAPPPVASAALISVPSDPLPMLPLN
jgi:hypothetical protein